MKVGVVGLGKLGMPVALALEAAGHSVRGWDASPKRRGQILERNLSEAGSEPHLSELLGPSNFCLYQMDLLCEWADIILVCVQTPHEPRFEGCTPVEDDPQDFDYSYLRDAVATIADLGTDALVVIVSTCLPGTFDRYIRPLAGRLRVAYHPLFIAMGSVIEDFRNPEFVLVGCDPEATVLELTEMYEPLLPLVGLSEGWRLMSIASAELTKVAYNAAIGFKLLLANTVAELCDKSGADCDDVMDTLKIADKRIASSAYLTPGMGDGGGCHPRDQIALSWLAREVGLSSDPFGFIVRAREWHAEWLADEWLIACEDSDLDAIMLGPEYKPNSPLTTGSHARLVLHYAKERDLDPVAYCGQLARTTWPVACYFIGCPHDWVLAAELPAGSVVVDPWGTFPEREGVSVIRPGRRAHIRERAGSPFLSEGPGGVAGEGRSPEDRTA